MQDNWRATRTFTIDAGVRFYVLTPTSNRGGLVAQFEPGTFDPAAAPLLFQPTLTPEGRRAINPVTGEAVPLVYLGRLVPESGHVDNGMTIYEGTPHRTSPFAIAPRAGFAWDVRGNGRTAIRGGFGTSTIATRTTTCWSSSRFRRWSAPTRPTRRRLRSSWRAR